MRDKITKGGLLRAAAAKGKSIAARMGEHADTAGNSKEYKYLSLVR